MNARTWLVTGATSGLGRELTRTVLERGGRVAACVRRPSALTDLAERFASNLLVVSADVADTSALRRAVDDAFAGLSPIDAVVSNAGYGLFGAAEEATDEQIDQQIATNLTGSIQLFRASVPHLRRQGGGEFVQVSSMGGQIGLPGLSVYHATKWGIEGFLEAAAREVAGFDIGVTIVEPGSMRTGFGKGSAVTTVPLAPYDHTVIGLLRRVMADGGASERGDPAKVATAIIDAVDVATCTDGPSRLVLGSDAHQLVRRALHARLAATDAARDLAYSTDADDVTSGRPM